MWIKESIGKKLKVFKDNQKCFPETEEVVSGVLKPKLVHPVKHRKKLTDEAKEITGDPIDDTRFLTYSKRVLGCFANLDLFPEIDVDDALASLAIISDGKTKRKFYTSKLFSSLVLRHTILVIDGWAVPASSFYLFELIKPGSMNIKKVALVLIPFIILTSAFVIVPSLSLFEYYWLFIIFYGIATVGLLFCLV